MRKLGFGFMRLPLTNPEDRSSIDQAQVNRMVDRYMEEGFTYFDTAYPYHLGKSETALREALVKRYPREAYTVTDKMPTFLVKSKEDYPRFFQEQLERTGLEYFDYYWLHTLGQVNYANTEKYDGFAFLRKLKEEGKAKHIGFSYHDDAKLLEEILLAHPETEYVQIQLNYVDWEDETIQARECYEVCKKYGKPVIVMEPVKGGSLAVVPEKVQELFQSLNPGKSPASWAIRYAASFPEVMTVLSGMSSLEQLEDNMSYMKEFRPLNDQEEKAIQEATKIIKSSIAIPCTACRYCTEGCPKKIAIPDYFSLYNNQHQFGFVPAHKNYYHNLLENHGAAGDCIGCKQCESHCPQHLPIISLLKEVSQVFDGQ